jgi:hypothetical protein
LACILSAKVLVSSSLICLNNSASFNFSAFNLANSAAANKAALVAAVVAFACS